MVFECQVHLRLRSVAGLPLVIFNSVRVLVLLRGFRQCTRRQASSKQRSMIRVAGQPFENTRPMDERLWLNSNKIIPFLTVGIRQGADASIEGMAPSQNPSSKNCFQADLRARLFNDSRGVCKTYFYRIFEVLPLLFSIFKNTFY